MVGAGSQPAETLFSYYYHYYCNYWKWKWSSQLWSNLSSCKESLMGLWPPCWSLWIFSGLHCNCLSYFTTAKITFTSTHYLQFICMIYITCTSYHYYYYYYYYLHFGCYKHVIMNVHGTLSQILFSILCKCSVLAVQAYFSCVTHFLFSVFPPPVGSY